MNTTTASATRIHPLMAAAAVSVIVVSLTGAAAITGMLPTSRGAAEPALTPATAAMPLAAGQFQATAVPPTAAHYTAAPVQPAPLVVSAAPGTTTYVHAANAPAAPIVIVKQEAAPVVKRTVVQKPRVAPQRPVQQVVRYEEPRRYEEPNYRPAPAPVAPAPAPAQPSYVGIGTGAVIGGLIGNQIGGGNGKKLATLAGVIGGGFLGNEVAKRNSN